MKISFILELFINFKIFSIILSSFSKYSSQSIDFNFIFAKINFVLSIFFVVFIHSTKPNTSLFCTQSGISL
ncbi:MAG: hypothetical protein LBQ24_06965 [Candidatus Peribacteria bacterium]|nr:hypothetical protein [Candidatus Peribacteria bacterium]